MASLNTLQLRRKYQQAKVLAEVTQAFESTASISVRQIKDRVIASREFFHELWQLYSQLRLDPKKHFESLKTRQTINKDIVVVVGSDTTITGGLDQRLVEKTLSDIDPDLVDIITVGIHVNSLFLSQGVKPIKAYPLPDITKKIFVLDIINQITKYQRSSVYFQAFVSLTQQRISHFELLFAVKQLTELEKLNPNQAILYSEDYIFEPSLEEVVDYLESMMLSTALTEVVLESRLAQLSSRFNATSQAKTKAIKLQKKLGQQISTLTRHLQDESLRHYTISRSIS